MREITEYYKIEPYTSTIDFLAKVCRAHGKLGKGGVPEMKQGAKIGIEDWNRGKLKYFTVPPNNSTPASSMVMMDEEPNCIDV